MKPSFKQMFVRFFVVQLFIMFFGTIASLALGGSFATRPYLEWIPNVIFTFCMFAFLWSSATYFGNHDLHLDEVHAEANANEKKIYKPHLGFLVALFVQLPAILVAALAFIPACSTVCGGVARIWYSMYSASFKQYASWLPWLFFVVAALFVAVGGLGYLNGQAYRQRQKKLNDRNRQNLQATKKI